MPGQSKPRWALTLTVTLSLQVLTYTVHWRCHVHMYPHARVVKAKVGSDKETSTGTLSIGTILGEEQISHKINETAKILKRVIATI